MTNDTQDWTVVSQVQLINSVKAALGDVAVQAPPADTASDTIGIVPIAGGGCLASFKAAGGSTIAKVGVFGAAATGLAASVSPAFGQATTAGDLLVAWVTSTVGEPTTGAAGWVKATDFQSGAGWVAIWVKPNCGNGEAAPTFTATSGKMAAALGEFSGVASASPTDQVSGANGVASTVSLLNPASDVAYKDLLLMASLWTTGNAQLQAMSQAWGNQAVGGQAATFVTGGAQQPIQQNSFSFAIVPAAPTILPLGVEAWDYDATGTSAPAAGSAASVVLVATPGKTYHAAFLSASIQETTGAADRVVVQLLDGATVIFSRYLAVPGVVGSAAGFDLSGVGFKGTAGNSMTFRFTAAAGGSAESVTIGAYLR